jgi:uncharacterized heparinase superfamily protein
LKLHNKDSPIYILLNKLYLYYHTLRYLKASQFFWRAWYKFYKPMLNSDQRPQLRDKNKQFVLPAMRESSLKDPNTFIFLNKTRALSEVGWDGTECPKLWRYNQHYFDDLNSLGASERFNWHQDLMKDWIIKNQPGEGTGWEPYPTSLRIVNWIKSSLTTFPLTEEFLQSLVIQTRWLNKKIEWHILGNHLFANAKALVFAGLFFEGKEATKWLLKGLKIIENQISEQILSDGAHFERSTMYHSIFLEDILDLINLMNTFPIKVGEENLKRLHLIAKKMLIWLDGICHPDGEISFFNDAAFKIAPSPTEIKLYALRIGVCSNISENLRCTLSAKHYVESGYIRMEAKNALVLLDVAPIGPDYQPGHGHADTLSFEMSLFNKRIFVNRGISEYEYSTKRLEERGTAAHNTVEINSKNSSEVWSSFRVANRAKPFDMIINQSETLLKVSCSHDGYKRLTGKPIHRRTWKLNNSKLLVKDKIEGFFVSAKARYYLHPDIKIISAGKFKWTLHMPNSKNIIHLCVQKGLASIDTSYYAPEFGIELLTKCLTVQFGALNEISIKITWVNYE